MSEKLCVLCHHQLILFAVAFSRFPRGVSLTSSILGYAILSSLQLRNRVIPCGISMIRDCLNIPFGVKENCCMQTAASAAAVASAVSV